MTTKLNAKQQIAIDTLREGHYIKSATHHWDGRQVYSTGLNSRTLDSLREKGLIEGVVLARGFVVGLVVHPEDATFGWEPIEDHDAVLEAEYRAVNASRRNRKQA